MGAAGDGECTGLGLEEVRGLLVTAGVLWKRLWTLPPGATPGPDRRLLLGPQGAIRGLRPVPTCGSPGPDPKAARLWGGGRTVPPLD